MQRAGESTAGSAATGGAGWPLLLYVAIGSLLLLLALLLHRNQKRLRLLGSSAHGVYCNADLADEIEPGVPPSPLLSSHPRDRLISSTKTCSALCS